MKKLILVFTAIVVSACTYAQTDTAGKKMSPPDFDNTQDGMNQNQELKGNSNQDLQNNSQPGINKSKEQAHPDGVMMENGKAMLVKDGKMTLLDREITLSNGTKLYPDGTILQKDGKKQILKEGQHMDLSGTIIPMKNQKSTPNK